MSGPAPAADAAGAVAFWRARLSPARHWWPREVILQPLDPGPRPGRIGALNNSRRVPLQPVWPHGVLHGNVFKRRCRRFCTQFL